MENYKKDLAILINVMISNYQRIKQANFKQKPHAQTKIGKMNFQMSIIHLNFLKNALNILKHYDQIVYIQFNLFKNKQSIPLIQKKFKFIFTKSIIRLYQHTFLQFDRFQYHNILFAFIQLYINLFNLYLYNHIYKNSKMRYHNQQRRGPRRQRRGGRRFDERRRKGSRDDGPRRFRRGSKDFNRRPNRDSNRNDDRSEGRRTGDRVRRRISRDPNGRRRISRDNKRNQKKQNRDLDGELMNYWVKGGRKNDEEGKNLAQQKLNQQMQNYWKQRAQTGEKKQQKPAN